MNLESINYNNEFGRCNLNNSIRKIKRKRKTKYSKELLRELNLDSDENILSSNESGDNNTFMKSQTDYSATFSEEALHKIKEMEEEIAKLKSQMELVCHLKTSQLNSMMLHEINHNKKSLNYQKYNNILLEENNENDCEITNHTTPPAPPPLPRVSNNNTPTNLIQNVKSNTFISPKILRLNNESLLNELQNVTLRHVEPVEKSKSFNSFLEEALYKKFKNVKENYSTDSEYSLSDWSE
uniref:Uncharacterized protein n=1 Tax=Parastrongyloides trichosuri TaxID=131310 RepID=A0A0N4ZGB5_PARTI